MSKTHVNPRAVGIRGEFPIGDNQLLSAEQETITFDGLDGNAAFMYRITAGFSVVQGGAVAPIITLNLNGDTGANYEVLNSELIGGNTYTGTSTSAQQAFYLHGAVTNPLADGNACILQLDIFATAGISTGHIIRSELFTNKDTGSGIGATVLSTGEWTNSDKIESIDIKCASAITPSAFAVGSRFQLSSMGLS